MSTAKRRWCAWWRDAAKTPSFPIPTRRKHRPARIWWAPWRSRCACGCPWYPCPDSLPYEAPPPAVSLGLDGEQSGYPTPGEPTDVLISAAIREYPDLPPGEALDALRTALATEDRRLPKVVGWAPAPRPERAAPLLTRGQDWRTRDRRPQ